MTRVRRRSVALVILFAALRLYATLGTRVGVASDTPTYFDFAWWGGIRFPVVTALYTVVEDHRAIVTIQILVGVAGWGAAVLLLGPLLQRAWVRLGFEVTFLTLGLTIPVLRFDTTLLSESLSVSFAVLLAALLLRLSCTPSRRLGVAALVVAALWGFSRPNNAVVLVVAAVAVATASFWVRPRRLVRYVAAGLAVIGLAGVVLATSNTTVQELNTAQILERRIIGEPEEQWFRDRGMPDPDDARARSGELMEDPAFIRWLRADGMSDYATFLVTHPGYVVRTSVDDRYPAGSFVMGVTDWSEWGTSRTVLPGFVERILWPTERNEAVVVLLLLVPIGALATARVVRARRSPAGAPMALAILATSLVNLLVVTHTAGESFGRLLIASSTSARIAVLWLLASAFDLDADRS